MEVADEVVHHDADGGHHDSGGPRAGDLGQSAAECSITVAAEFEAVAPGLEGAFVLLFQRSAVEELLLDGQLPGHMRIRSCVGGQYSRTTWRAPDGSQSRSWNAFGASSAGTRWVMSGSTSRRPDVARSTAVDW